MHVALQCPDCQMHTVFSGRGRCICGTYLIHHWNGMNAHRSLIVPWGRVLMWDQEEKGWHVLRGSESGRLRDAILGRDADMVIGG